MSAVESTWIEQQLEGAGPRRPLAEIVQELNRIYHAVEARDYDRKHSEIFTQLPPIWAEMIDAALEALGSAPLEVLDFGCGTGFEAGQVVDRVPHDRLTALTCYDLSDEMLSRCRAAIGPQAPQARFISDWRGVAPEAERFNLIVSNSVLHHLPNLDQTIDAIAGVSAAGAVWIAGHEPSSRYYRNPECMRALAAFRKERRWRRLLEPRNYWNRAREAVGLRSSPAKSAAKRAVEAGLFEREPSTALVSRLVDYHVAHDSAEVQAGRGLDFEDMAERLSGRWELLRVRTYSYMGPFYEARLPRRWREACKQLARDYPSDGSNFCTLWVKVA